MLSLMYLSHCFVCLALASHFGVKSHRYLFCIWSLFLSLLGYVSNVKVSYSYLRTLIGRPSYLHGSSFREAFEEKK
jgi:hypothetical protein